MIYLALLLIVFIASLGNAMNRRVYRRSASIAAGKTTEDVSRTYNAIGRALFTVGAVFLLAWIVAVILARTTTLLDAVPIFSASR